MIATCLEKNPGARYASAAEVREALKTIMKALQIETGDHSRRGCGEPAHDGARRRRSARLDFCRCWRSDFASRRRSARQQNSLVVLPFANLGATEVAPLYGYALADAIAARLARIPALVVRPSSTLMSLPIAQMDPLSVGQQLLVSYVLAGSFVRSENWVRSELAVAGCGFAERAFGRSHPGGFARSDCSAVGDFERSVCCVAWTWQRPNPDRMRRRSALRDGSLPGPVSEEYLQARAQLSSFMVRTGSRVRSRSRARTVYERHARKIRSLRRDGADWGSRSCSMCGTDLAGRST